MMAAPALPAATFLMGASGVSLFSQSAADAGVPDWLNLASTTGLGVALGWFVWKLSKGELVSSDADQRDDELRDVLARSQAQNDRLASLLEDAAKREDRLMKYLEDRST